jgi:hypothetical protein
MTTLITQLGFVDPQIFKLHPPEDKMPSLHNGFFALLSEHSDRKFAFRIKDDAEWSHGNKSSLYDYIVANKGATVLVRLYADIRRMR